MYEQEIEAQYQKLLPEFKKLAEKSQEIGVHNLSPKLDIDWKPLGHAFCYFSLPFKKKSNSRRVTREEFSIIRRRAEQGDKKKDIAQSMGINVNRVSEICNGYRRFDEDKVGSDDLVSEFLNGASIQELCKKHSVARTYVESRLRRKLARNYEEAKMISRLHRLIDRINRSKQ